MIKNLRIHDQFLFFIGSIGILLGIFLTNIFHENTLFLLLFFGIIFIQILFFFRIAFVYGCLFVILFFSGMYISSVRFNGINDVTRLLEHETIFFTQNVSIRGTIVDKISENKKNTKYVLRHLKIGSQEFPSKIGIIVTCPDSRNKNIEDIITFSGIISLPLGSEKFDYRTYLLLDNIYGTTSVSFPEKIGHNKSSWGIIFIRDTREKILSMIENIYPGETAKLLQGMLIGERANLSADTKKNFNNSGLTHIIAVSGFNITIILIFLSFLFRSFSFWARLFLAFLCIGFFTLLVGPQISVLRASIFGLISYTILLSGRKMRVFSLLLAVAIGFVLFDPLVLNYDVSFHLSFLAVFGLLYFGDFFNRMFSFLPKWFGLRDSLSMCFAAMIFTLPILMINFGQISIIAPLSNIAIVPIIPLVMLSGFVSLLAGYFSPYIGVVLGFPTWMGLSYILNGIKWFGEFSYATVPINLGLHQYFFEILYFMIIVFIILFFHQKQT